jgi:acyl-CoA thioesterase-1
MRLKVVLLSILFSFVSLAVNAETGTDNIPETGPAIIILGDSLSAAYGMEIKQALGKHEPGVVILELGGNDGLRGLPIEVTRQNLSRMIEKSQSAGSAVIIAEMRIPPNYGRSYTEKFNAMYPALTEQYGISLLPFLLQDIALKPGLMLPDGIHPTAQAQPLILDQVWTVLQPLLISY